MTDKQGRPVGSSVRDRMVNILYHYDHLHGYKIHDIYETVYEEVSRRLIYYHLDKGVKLGEFQLHSVEEQRGEYSWGDKVQRKRYELGPNAEPSFDKRLKNYKDAHSSD